MVKLYSGIGQDSHRFLDEESSKPCYIAGMIFPDAPGLDADSDGDVVLHALCNAITSITHVPILGEIAPMLVKEGIRDSSVYLEKALETLGEIELQHLAFTIEGKRPRLQPSIFKMRERLASLTGLEPPQVGITATSGDGLTEFGRGHGLQCFCVAAAVKHS